MRTNCVALLLSGFLFLMMSCVDPNTPTLEDVDCIDETLLHQTSGKPKIRPSFAAIDTEIWPVGDRKIKLCWNAETYYEADQVYREIVKQAVTQTWGQVLGDSRVPEEYRVEFFGWQKCEATSMDSIEISVRDSVPRAALVGYELRGMIDAVSFNFEFQKWNPDDCGTSDEATKRKCIYGLAVHEFGHVLGITHEHNRSDTDTKTCTRPPSGSKGNVWVGDHDEHSVMNYCNKKWNNDGELSQWDRIGIQVLYFKPFLTERCRGYLRAAVE